MVEFNCLVCNQIARCKNSRKLAGGGKYCSHKCQGKAQMGVNNPFWKGGKSAQKVRWNAYHNKYKKVHRDYYNHREAIRRALKSKATGSFTFSEWVNLKTELGSKCLACGVSEPDIALSIDHIIPISKGGSNNIDNIQPLCKPCNSRKNAKTVNYKELAYA